MAEIGAAHRLRAVPTWTVHDAGGQPAGGGATVRTGRLFRGAAPAGIAAAEVEAQARRLGLATVVDLRAERERARDGDFPLGSPDVRLVHAPMAREAAGAAPPPLPELYAWTARTHRRAFASVLSTLAAPGAHPALVCCTAGRDRTGMVIALVLDVLGVPHPAIVEGHAGACGGGEEPIRSFLRGLGGGERFALACGASPATLAAIRRELLTQPS